MGNPKGLVESPAYTGQQLIPDPFEKSCIERDVNAKMDQGSANAPPPL
jgi:hypothetical protein